MPRHQGHTQSGLCRACARASQDVVRRGWRWHRGQVGREDRCRAQCSAECIQLLPHSVCNGQLGVATPMRQDDAGLHLSPVAQARAPLDSPHPHSLPCDWPGIHRTTLPPQSHIWHSWSSHLQSSGCVRRAGPSSDIVSATKAGTTNSWTAQLLDNGWEGTGTAHHSLVA